MSKQRILNYEVSMIEYCSEGLSKPDSSPNHQYTTWQLDEKILQLMGSSPCTIRWIGNHQSAYLDTFVYVILSLALKNQSLILKLKSKIYQLSQKYLEKSNQKLIVEFLCLLQYTQDKYSFLRKYPEVVKMIVFVLNSYEKQTTYKDTMDMTNFILESPIKEKRNESFSVFCEKFNFITVLHPNESIYRFESQNNTISVIIEKDCFFVVQKFPVLSDQKDMSGKMSQKKIMNSTPKFSMPTSTLRKRKSQKQRAQNYFTQKNKSSEKKFENHNNESIVCSIQEIYNQLQRSEVQKRLIKKQQPRKYRTETQIRSKNSKKSKSKSQTKDGESLDNFLAKQIEHQQRRRQHWRKVQKEYYERKKQISRKNRKQRNKFHNQPKQIFSKNQHHSNDSKQRKMSFNSFTGSSIQQRFDTDFSEMDYDRRSTTKSQQSQYLTREQIRSRKISKKESPVVESKILKKMSNKRLSIIQQEDRLKFETFKSAASTMHRSPKPTSYTSSNRETFDANFCVTFNYINKTQNSPSEYQSRSFHKLRYHAPLIRV